MEIKVKLLNDKRYKNSDTFDDAVERWQDKGWILADVAQDIEHHGDDTVAILWKPIDSAMRKLLWGRWTDKDIKENPHLLKTCLECNQFDDDCPYLERVIKKYGNAPACSLHKVGG